jgi:hypothetical protein
MRQLIKGLVAAFAVMTAGAAPAFACGYSPCGTSYEQAYTYEQPAYTYAPAYTYGYSQGYTGCGSCGTVAYTGCGSCGSTGWGYEQLAEPTTQYYYVNQGPTYTGPGAFAPEPTYQEDAVPSYGYGYGNGYGYRHHYRPYGYHYGYAPRHYGYGGYAHHYGYRYGGYARHYGFRYGHEGSYWGHPLVRRYY